MSSTAEETKDKLSRGMSNNDLGTYLMRAGGVLILAGIVLGIAIFYPVLKEEFLYAFNSNPDALVENNNAPTTSDKDVITPRDAEFGIVIPKINANASVIENVDPYNESEYQLQLTKGVAHAKGTATPPENGSIFLFSHSSVDFYKASRYNSIFYLINKLQPGDDIYLFYDKNKYRYEVRNQTIVDPGDVSYLTDTSNERIVRLMTCWPPGTTFQRLIVEAELIPNN